MYTTFFADPTGDGVPHGEFVRITTDEGRFSRLINDVANNEMIEKEPDVQVPVDTTVRALRNFKKFLTVLNEHSAEYSVKAPKIDMTDTTPRFDGRPEWEREFVRGLDMTEAAELLDAAYYFDAGIVHLAVATGMAAVFSRVSEDRVKELATKIKDKQPTPKIGQLLG